MTKVKALLSIVVLLILGGFSAATSSNVEVQPVSNGSVTIEEDLLKKMKIVKDDSEIGSGELTKENISFGVIHIGDSAEAVRKLLGETTSKGILNSTPFPLWHYEKQNIDVAFYYNFYPLLRVLLKGDKVTSIEISNEKEQP